MKQLTRDEIIELRARAIYNAVPPCENGFTWEYVKQHLIPAKVSYQEMAKATIEADEKAGVLILVEEGSPELDGDVVQRARITDYEGKEHIEILKIIERANTPVYQCAKDNE